MSDERDISEYTAANRRAWEELEPRHRQTQFERLARAFAGPDYSYLDEVSVGILRRLGVEGKDVAHLACNNGREILSIKRMGAGRCVGFDISASFIEQGKELARIGNIDVELVANDVYEIPKTYDSSFDIVFVSVGALILMPNMDVFFQIVRRLLRGDGCVFIYERHPVLDMFHWSDKDDPPVIRESYFRSEPFIRKKNYDYWAKVTYDSAPMCTFHHKLSDVINAILNNGIQLESFEEYGHDISEMFSHFQRLKLRPPLSYSLVGRVQS